MEKISKGEVFDINVYLSDYDERNRYKVMRFFIELKSLVGDGVYFWFGLVGGGIIDRKRIEVVAESSFIYFSVLF